MIPPRWPYGMARSLLDLFLPRACLACGGRIPPEETNRWICVSCRLALRPPPEPSCRRCGFPLGTGLPEDSPCLECAGWPPPLASARSVVLLDPVSRSLVHALKYHGWAPLADSLAEAMAALPVPAPPTAPVVPVPTTPARRRMRGYNQAALLAWGVARRRGCACLELLERVGKGSQVGRSPRGREAHMEGAFRRVARGSSLAMEEEVILVDDVLTTGATARRATLALVAGGVRKVHLLTFARALPYGGWR